MHVRVCYDWQMQCVFINTSQGLEQHLQLLRRLNLPLEEDGETNTTQDRLDCPESHCPAQQTPVKLSGTNKNRQRMYLLLYTALHTAYSQRVTQGRGILL